MFQRKEDDYLAAFLDATKKSSYGKSRPYKTYALKKMGHLSRTHLPLCLRRQGTTLHLLPPQIVLSLQPRRRRALISCQHRLPRQTIPRRRTVKQTVVVK